MNEPVHWWQQEAASFLNDTLAFINSSRTKDDSIGRCFDLCQALNKTWNAFFEFRRKKGKLNDKEKENEAVDKRADNQSFQELLLHGLSDQKKSALCRRDSVRCFATFTPQIMNHARLLSQRYDPFSITEDVRKKASDEHRQLAKALDRFLRAPNDSELLEALLKKIAQLIYIVRSNIAHSEKTPQGPDLAKAERDCLVSEVTVSLIEDVFDVLLDWPSQRLAVYGTLTPDGVNASQLAGLNGSWHEATVPGIVAEKHGLREFYWTLTETSVQLKIFSAVNLQQEFDRLDRFEGSHYQRSLVPVAMAGQLSVCNIYQGNCTFRENHS